MASERVTTADLQVGDFVADAPEGCRITSIEEEPGPLRVTWEDGESLVYERDVTWERKIL